ncbi:SRPBCC family protein [Allokutzneria sp. A3M-2-11 16]|uniref:SRPBCC family protein n=1 Tax=Allokutzneria sp. A3M-2-11 16 TaxID=2962043 RepID=UPI0020B7BD1C|nr:SRPBCC family protein [Allokutzneria sp. A3M-2-11 16]MCP3801765.1 SRPBCC family protein [Allokutzneria sp. A3M-2-11 16]
MADQSTQSIVIDAAPDQIMAVISDFAKYPEWAEAVKHTEVLSSDSAGRGEQVRFVIDAGPLKDEYVLDYDWADDGRSVSWNLVKGQMQKAQSGSYVLAPEGSSTKVTYSLSVELTIPMIGLFRRKAEKMIMDVALKELKNRAESAA